MTVECSILERLLARTEITDTCWLWKGAKSVGYGHIRLSKPRRNPTTHRTMYELVVGPIPDGLWLDHLCRVRNCLNPDHLEPVTPSENVRRGLTPEVNRARHKAKTHCPYGHEYTEDNIRPHARGWRSCKTCHRERERIRQPQRKARKRLEAGS